MGQNNQEYRLKYWVTRSSVRSFARTAHSFACSALLASLARTLRCAPTSASSWDKKRIFVQGVMPDNHSTPFPRRRSESGQHVARRRRRLRRRRRSGRRIPGQSIGAGRIYANESGDGTQLRTEQRQSRVFLAQCHVTRSARTSVSGWRHGWRWRYVTRRRYVTRLRGAHVTRSRRAYA